tara:strand:- start:280 stop:600 length:321 start_codon:yes stop_codon:yes gene_type:complete
MKKIYISGQITGLKKRECYNTFETAVMKLRRLNLSGVSPYKGDEGKTWNEYMKQGIETMMNCEGIFMLSNWRESRGANIERNLAMQLGMRVMYEDLFDTNKYARED